MMDVMFTTHLKDGPGKYYMVVAEASEWADVLSDLKRLAVITCETQDLIEGLKGWGVGD